MRQNVKMWHLDRPDAQRTQSISERNISARCNQPHRRGGEHGIHSVGSEGTKLRIFISYRRVDQAGFAGRLFDWINRDPDLEDSAFMDVDGIAAGQNYDQVLRDRLRRATLSSQSSATAGSALPMSLGRSV